MPWLGKERGQIRKVATYSLLFNASLMVEEGLGYAVCLDKIINTSGESKLCFRPLSPQSGYENACYLEKYQVFSKAADKYLQQLRQSLEQNLIFP